VTTRFIAPDYSADLFDCLRLNLPIRRRRRIYALIWIAAEGVGAFSENRKLAAILVADVVGYSRLTGADEDRISADPAQR
jgi:class 3 adenylate cyclase